MKTLILILGILTTIGSLILLLLNPIVSLLFLAFGIVLIVYSQKMETTQNKPKIEPQRKITYDYFYLANTENAGKVIDYFKSDLEENDDYNLPKKELIEDYYDEKVWKYDPYELESKVIDNQVYAMLDDWVKVGTIRQKDIDKERLTLYLFVNEYKYVSDDVEKDKGDSYFGFKYKEG